MADLKQAGKFLGNFDTTDLFLYAKVWFIFVIAPLLLAGVILWFSNHADQLALAAKNNSAMVLNNRTL